jgi:hypothetical protein
MVEAGIPVCAHNAKKFDGIIWERVLKWPKPKEWVDTCAIAWSYDLEGSLDALAHLIGRSKDGEGQKLVIALNERYRRSNAKPKRPPVITEGYLESIINYCKDDVSLLADVWRFLIEYRKPTVPSFTPEKKPSVPKTSTIVFWVMASIIFVAVVISKCSKDDKVPSPTVATPSTSAAPSADVSGPGLLSTFCGDPGHKPKGVAIIGQWEKYRCSGRADASAIWTSCLQRVRYSDEPGMGCPLDELCCPSE